MLAHSLYKGDKWQCCVVNFKEIICTAQFKIMCQIFEMVFLSVVKSENLVVGYHYTAMGGAGFF